MLQDESLKKIVDFPDANEVFPGVDIAGGVCYFLWDKEHSGNCEIINNFKGQVNISTRRLNEFEILIRHGKSVSIIHKIRSLNESTLSEQVSSAKPFGLRTFVRPSEKGDIILKWNGGEGPYKSENVEVGREMIDKWKVITSKVSYDHGGQPDKNGMRRVFSILDILPPKTICTETYLVVGVYEDKKEAFHLANYLKTKFVRFLVAQLSFSQDIFKDKFLFVPIQDFKEAWTDEKLYDKYGLNKDEIVFIDSMIRPMDLTKNDRDYE